MLFGLGNGLAFVPLTAMALAASAPPMPAPPPGWSTSSQQVGGALGLAVLVTVFGHSASPDGSTLSATAIQAAQQSFVVGADRALTVASALTAAAAIIVAVMMRPPNRRAEVGRDGHRRRRPSRSPELNWSPSTEPGTRARQLGSAIRRLGPRARKVLGNWAAQRHRMKRNAPNRSWSGAFRVNRRGIRGNPAGDRGTQLLIAAELDAGRPGNAAVILDRGKLTRRAGPAGSGTHPGRGLDRAIGSAASTSVRSPDHSVWKTPSLSTRW